MSAFKILETEIALPEKMYGVALIRIGGPEMLEWRADLTVPAPSENDVIVRAKAAGVNNTYIKMLNGWYSKGANSVDVVLDLVAGPQWPALLDVLRPHGRYAVVGAIAGPIVELDVRTLYLKDLSFIDCTILGCQVFKNLVKRMERKEIAPLVAETYPLRDIAKAQSAFSEKGHIGKIVL